VPKLLRALELSGCIVTLDAMGCQKEIVKEIKEADAEYVLAFKGNQGQTHAEVKSYLDDAISRQAKELAYVEVVDKGHERQEVWRYWQSGRLDWFEGRSAWEGLQSVGVVEAVREIGGQRTVERRYYLSSLLNLIKADQQKKKRSLKGQMKGTGWDNRCLLHLLARIFHSANDFWERVR
jgi:hypothetical protein